MADDAPPPPWVRHPEIPRYSIGWRMGYGESYLDHWWQFAQARNTAALVDYFRAHAPIPVEWVDFVGMALDLPHRDPITAAEVDEPEDFDEAIRRSGERIAHLGLFDVDAWRAYLDA
jgi:hypothetical protein